MEFQAGNSWTGVWERFRKGDKEAFAILYNSHVDALYAYGCKLCHDSGLVKDALQEIFIELYNKRESSNIPVVRLRYYLLLALKRNLVKKLVKGRKFQSINGKADFPMLDEPSEETKWIEQERSEEVSDMVGRTIEILPAKQREAIYLRFTHCLDYEEISRILGISVESVRKQVYRGVKSIRNSIGKESVTLFFLFSAKKS